MCAASTLSKSSGGCCSWLPCFVTSRCVWQAADWHAFLLARNHLSTLAAACGARRSACLTAHCCMSPRHTSLVPLIACAVPRRPHPAAAAAAAPLLMLLPHRSHCCCRSAHTAAAAPFTLRRRWDAKTLTNIALWAGLFPYAIYRGCIAEVRLGCPGREHACVPSSCWLEARASQRCKAPVPYPWRLCRTPLAAASQFI